jgi:hypothetical protein
MARCQPTDQSAVQPQPLNPHPIWRLRARGTVNRPHTHLLNNLRDAYERLLARHTGQLREAAGTDQRGAASRSRVDRRARARTVGRITTRIFATAASVERPGWPAMRIRHRHFVEELCRLEPSIAAACRMACTFFGLVRYHDLDGFDHWLAHARAGALPQASKPICQWCVPHSVRRGAVARSTGSNTSSVRFTPSPTSIYSASAYCIPLNHVTQSAEDPVFGRRQHALTSISVVAWNRWKNPNQPIKKIGVP